MIHTAKIIVMLTTIRLFSAPIRGANAHGDVQREGSTLSSKTQIVILGSGTPNADPDRFGDP